jgi:hypothetical protein
MRLSALKTGVLPIFNSKLQNYPHGDDRHS